MLIKYPLNKYDPLAVIGNRERKYGQRDTFYAPPGTLVVAMEEGECDFVHLSISFAQSTDECLCKYWSFQVCVHSIRSVGWSVFQIIRCWCSIKRTKATTALQSTIKNAFEKESTTIVTSYLFK